MSASRVCRVQARGVLAGLALAGLLGSSPATAASGEDWPGYLDYAYIYQAADREAMQARLDRYASSAGRSLEAYLAKEIEWRAESGESLGDDDRRRLAIGRFLLYRSTGNRSELDAAIAALRGSSAANERPEQRYWLRTLRAHQALERREASTFTRQLFDLWVEVILPLEETRSTYASVSLDSGPRAGFVSALPYLYENLSRLILIRTQQMGVDWDLDALGSIVRMLHAGRVGRHPDLIPADRSSRSYLERVIARLDGAESDGGSLTFTLALFEASKLHDRARATVAEEGLSDAALNAHRVAVGAYRKAFARARTLQGQTAVTVRALRQLGEMAVAQQRSGATVEIDSPFSVTEALKLYQAMHAGLRGGWEQFGYRDQGREAFVTALRGLWQEIQESAFNTADLHFSRGIASADKGPRKADREFAEAARIFSEYLAAFERYAEPVALEGLPATAYFAAHEAARGVADATALYGDRGQSSIQSARVAALYQRALDLYPFDPRLWASFAGALQGSGRERDFLSRTATLSGIVARARVLDDWIEHSRPEAQSLGSMRQAIADPHARIYLGLADAEALTEIEDNLVALRERDQTLRQREGVLAAGTDDAELPQVSSSRARSDLREQGRRLAELRARATELEQQIATAERTLPVFREALGATPIADAMRIERDHPVHELVRDLYYETHRFESPAKAAARR